MDTNLHNKVEYLVQDIGWTRAGVARCPHCHAMFLVETPLRRGSKIGRRFLLGAAYVMMTIMLLQLLLLLTA